MIDLRLGDCLEVMAKMEAQSVDAIITDPPYGLSFMGKKWDYDVPSVEIWTECLRVLKPGGYLLAFAGTRTQHRMAVRIEDAGFEIRDMIAWVYGSGFPKSLNVGKTLGEWEGWGTALKPALEPITVARKPLIGTVAENVLAWGTGALNIDRSRVEAIDQKDLEKNWNRVQSAANGSDVYKNGMKQIDLSDRKPLGRFPANFIHDGSEEVLAGFPESNGGAFPKKSNIPSGKHYEGGWGTVNNNERTEMGTGSAARFFYCAKASKSERGEGNSHPTVKPAALMEYLIKLVSREGAVILDPFAGSGTTGTASKKTGRKFIGIEKDPAYFQIAKRRIEEAQLELSC